MLQGMPFGVVPDAESMAVPRQGVSLFAGSADINYRADIRMVQCRGGASLAVETLQYIGVVVAIDVCGTLSAT
jgi:hypothetical protein